MSARVRTHPSADKVWQLGLQVQNLPGANGKDNAETCCGTDSAWAVLGKASSSGSQHNAGAGYDRQAAEHTASRRSEIVLLQRWCWAIELAPGIVDYFVIQRSSQTVPSRERAGCDSTQSPFAASPALRDSRTHSSVQSKRGALGDDKRMRTSSAPKLAEPESEIAVACSGGALGWRYARAGRFTGCR
ncbi:hypothetical protein OPT61_g10591 [Boeremia exigua]|uniref:Uncharacterized protein n=1 Tax=Boeremia exigua TaxID=749465 RepID=A0ACC2HNU7_9PLEO|nr:hypothetical protein OPT61_g10591 [Boeremia exigua]